VRNDFVGHLRADQTEHLRHHLPAEHELAGLLRRVRHHLADHPEVAQTSQDKGVNSPQSESTVRLQVAVAVLSGGFVKGEIQAAISVGGRRSP